ncbi:hypothetical protein RUM43_008954 [Polyplax serrata]|uniref:Uncharacterized protein n=1 Tax=Polyplax serrata TaxID=468196 RepID=A0AAN8S8A7_POLSC
MNCLCVLVLAAIGATSAAVVAPVGLGLNGHGLNGHGLNGHGLGGTLGATVSETVITPFHRTDAVAGPCSKTIVHTSTFPVVEGNRGVLGGFGTGAGFAYPGTIGNGVGAIAGGIGHGVAGGFTGGLAGIDPLTEAIIGPYPRSVGCGYARHLGGVGSLAGTGVGHLGGGLLGGVFPGGHYGIGNGIIA